MSNSQTEFAVLSMDVIYRLEKDLPLEEVAELYRVAGWMSLGEEPSGLAPMLQNSFAVQAAFEAGTGRLLGIMRALSDGCSDAYLLDLVVLPEARRKGIGREIVEHLAVYLKSLGIEWIVCIGAPGTKEFYNTTSGKAMEGFVPWRFENPQDNS
ncbi:MAG: GNAT family N-acetyltransferase [Victivallales bacterium]|nr:GNAT family N-acetyltransferase [Victivallales bacterium]